MLENSHGKPENSYVQLHSLVVNEVEIYGSASNDTYHSIRTPERSRPDHFHMGLGCQSQKKGLRKA
jgi:hypothetical protein